MHIVERAGNILFNSKKEWLIVQSESTTFQKVFTNYVFPMAVLASLGEIIPVLLPLNFYGNLFIWLAFIKFISIIVGFAISVYVIEMLAPGFNSESNMGRSAQLLAYSNTPVWIAGFLFFIPGIGLLVIMAGWFFFFYLFYNGLTVMKRTPEDKKVVYMVVSILVMIGVYFIISVLLKSIIAPFIDFGLVENIGGFGY